MRPVPPSKRGRVLNATAKGSYETVAPLLSVGIPLEIETCDGNDIAFPHICRGRKQVPLPKSHKKGHQPFRSWDPGR